jgi:neutral ceramidase
MCRMILLCALGIGVTAPWAFAAPPADLPSPVPVGVAVLDITPKNPIRLVGYGSRKTESEGIESPLKARALVIGGDDAALGGPAVIVAVDNCAVGANVTEEVAKRLNNKVGLKRERLVVSSTHTHCGPALTTELDFIFGSPIPADQKARIAQYTGELTDALEKVVLAALGDRSPASLSWGQGQVGFAANRRVLKNGHWVDFGVNPNGPVDHSLPVLKATDASGKVRAVLFGYACHCTTLGGEFNKICAEWTGYACDEIEQQSPGSIALAVIGCGADANPEPRRGLDDAKEHGHSAAREVNRLVKTTLAPLPGRVDARFRKIELPLEPHPDRATLERRSKNTGSEGYLARTMLERLERGEKLPTTVVYPVQTWCFGDEMAMVFMGGEVVVDYALRLKWEIDQHRLWIVAYSNDVPCYIPSRRILSEGGYEADLSMVFYGQPARFAPATEDLIIEAIHSILPDPFDGPRKP